MTVRVSECGGIYEKKFTDQVARGIEVFFQSVKKVGADSVLIADVPLLESGPFHKIAKNVGIHLTHILPLDAGKDTIRKAARQSGGYLYILSRNGVTGVGQKAGLPSPDFLEYLDLINAPPAVLGFGISTPRHVSAALKARCSGVISGSAVVQQVEDFVLGKATLDDLNTFIKSMKAATHSR